MNNTKTKKQTFLEGKVVSTAMAKTVTVVVVHQFRHPLYKKAVNRMKKFAVHSEISDLKVGDTVRITETKPMSKRKHYMVVAKVG